MKVKVESISIAEGVSKTTGKPYKRAVLEFNGQEASMFINEKFGQKDLDTVKTWKEGDLVDIIIEQNGQYANFKLPSKTDMLSERVFDLEGRLDKIEELLRNAKKNK